MTTKQLEQRLAAALLPQAGAADARPGPPPPQCLAQAQRAAAHKARRERVSFGSFFLRQMRYLAWKIWLAQGLALALLCGLMTAAYRGRFLARPGYIALVLCGAAVLVLLTSLPFLQRGVRYQMHETEAATRFSAARLLAARLLLVGAGDAVMLVTLLLLTVLQTPLGVRGALVYLLLPFLAVTGGLLFLLTHAPAVRVSAGCVGLAVLLFGAAAALYWQCPTVLEQSFFGAWLCVCAALVLYCVRALRRVFRGCRYAELQLV